MSAVRPTHSQRRLRRWVGLLAAAVQVASLLLAPASAAARTGSEPVEAERPCCCGVGCTMPCAPTTPASAPEPCREACAAPAGVATTCAIVIVDRPDGAVVPLEADGCHGVAAPASRAPAPHESPPAGLVLSRIEVLRI